ncbi:tyrosine-protein phosphatase [Pseudonocardia spinosispora]|uniref:tyrosine-protein phosphatase n=1 Tax=Pseudonocardia spinosispora TaxID=103441 RepID=UPI000401F51A|nr:tyrosine-protein phosphatase [Pseudonocardia spinosispora]
MTEQRWVRLEGVENVRDLGGLPLTGGGHTRFGQVLRSARLHELTESDVEFLVEKFGIRTVIDLRSPKEVDRDGPTPMERAGVRTEHLTVLPTGQRPIPRDDEDPKLFNYRGYLADRPENMLAAVRLLTEPDAGPALVHCAAGKDRTGVFCALVEDAVGVRREAVIEDYALSNEALEAVLRRGVGTEYQIDPADIDLYRCPPQVMTALLADLDPDGAAEGWLLRHGMPSDELATLRARLTE